MKKWAPYVVGILGGAAIFGAVASADFWIPWTDDHAGLGGWMQGVFTAVAIIGAYLGGERAAGHQRSLERQRAEAEDLRFREKAAALATMLKVAVETIGGFSAVIPFGARRDLKEIEASTYKLRLSVIASAMEAFPAERLPPAAMWEFLTLTGLAANAKPMFDGLGETRRSGDAVRVEHMASSVRTIIDLVRDGEERLRDALKAPN